MKLHSFRSSRLLGAVCTVLLAAQLAACSGGSGSSPPPSTPTPPPSGGSPPTNPPPAPTTVSLTLSGTVTDAPIANAVVTATVGDETFTATADASGNYSLEIEIEEANAGAFVTLSARGVGDQAFVEFTSLAGSFQALATQAGSDDTLSSTENFATQITNFSTAEAVFLREANGGQPVTSDALLQTLSSAVNAQDVLDLAAAIKLTVDDAANYPMPAGQTSILELASDPAARQQFVDDVYEQDPAAFANTQASIVHDAGLAQPVEPQQDHSFTSVLLSTDPNFSFNYSGRVLHFDLYEDGTGSVQSETFDQSLTWTVEDSTIRVTYDTPVETVSFDTENCVGGGGVRQVEAHYVAEGATIAFLSERTVAVTTTSDVTYADCPSLAPRADVSTEARTILTMDHLQPIDAEELHGETDTIYVYDAAQQAIVADIAVLGADGTGTTRLTHQSFTWGVDESGKLIAVEFADGTTAEYGLLREIDAISSDLYWEVRTVDGPVYTGAGASIFADPEYPAEFTAEDVPGRYYQFGMGDETVVDARLKGFRLRFDANLMGSHEADHIDENDQLVTIDSSQRASDGFRWTVEDGEVVVRRTFDLVLQQETCLYGDADCLLYDERRIIPLAMDGNRVYWVEVRRFDLQGVTASTPASQLVRFYDYEPLSEAATVGASKTRAARSAQKSRALLRGPQLR
jgi:hypothetical protein